MFLILFNIEEIIEEIDTSREKTEDAKGGYTNSQHLRMEQIAGKN